MGGSVSLTGNDTIIIDNRVLSDLANADTCAIEFANNLVEGKVGKNGNVIYAFNASGKTATAKIRLIRGSADDKFFNSRMLSYINDPAGFTLMVGEFIKRAGDGQGNVTADVYQFDGGIIQKIPNTKENVEGDTEQSVSEYTVLFANTNRIMS